MGETIVVFDLETAGTNVKCDVIQIAGMVLENDCPSAKRFEIKLLNENPENNEPGVLGVFNHYNEQEWSEKAVTQEEGFKRFHEWTSLYGHSKLCGQNIANFDVPFIKNRWEKYGYKWDFNHHIIDTQIYFDLFARVVGYDGRKSLQNICEYFELVNPKAHDALSDVITEGTVYCMTVEYLKLYCKSSGRYTHANYLQLVKEEIRNRLGKR